MNKELTLPDASQVRYSVVRIIARLNVGGPAQHVLHLARELTRTYPTLVVTGDPEPDELEIPTVGDGIHIVRVKELGRSVRAINDLVALIKVWRILRKTRPRIVHTH